MTTAPLLEQLRRHTTSHIRQDDLNEVARRALVRILALCAWQLSHDGQFPDRLELPAPRSYRFCRTTPTRGSSLVILRRKGSTSLLCTLLRMQPHLVFILLSQVPSFSTALDPMVMTIARRGLSPIRVHQ